LDFGFNVESNLDEPKLKHFVRGAWIVPQRLDLTFWLASRVLVVRPSPSQEVRCWWEHSVCSAALVADGGHKRSAGRLRWLGFQGHIHSLALFEVKIIQARRASEWFFPCETDSLACASGLYCRESNCSWHCRVQTPLDTNSCARLFVKQCSTTLRRRL